MLKNLIPFGFFINLSLFATNKLHLSAYLCTPSGTPQRGVCPVGVQFVRSESFFLSPNKDFVPTDTICDSRNSKIFLQMN